MASTSTTTNPSNILEKLQFLPLETDGSNFLQWSTHAKIHLRSQGLIHTIKDKYDPDKITVTVAATESSSTDAPATVTLTDEEEQKKAATAVRILQRHISLNLQMRFLNIENPSVLWSTIETTFSNVALKLLPKLINEWNLLRVESFKTIDEYDGELTRIANFLTHLGHSSIVSDELKIQKTVTTFPPSMASTVFTIPKSDGKSYDEFIKALRLMRLTRWSSHTNVANLVSLYLPTFAQKLTTWTPTTTATNLLGILLLVLLPEATSEAVAVAEEEDHRTTQTIARNTNNNITSVIPDALRPANAAA